jgi:hypothetical protein
MPNRIIREGWVESEAVDALSCEAERFFIRLCLKADDYGRFHAHPQLLKSHLFPLRETLRSTDIAAWLAECEKAGLVRCYAVARKRYLLIPKFKQRFRAKESKFPPPPLQADDEHASDTRPSCAHGDGDGDEVSETKTQGEGDGRDGALAAPHIPSVIPSVKEVEEYGVMHGVPVDYCRHYHAVCSEKHRWLVGKPGAERLIGWQSEMKRWWEKDRTTWKSKGKCLGGKQIPETIDVPTL